MLGDVLCHVFCSLIDKYVIADLMSWNLSSLSIVCIHVPLCECPCNSLQTAGLTVVSFLQCLSASVFISLITLCECAVCQSTVSVGEFMPSVHSCDVLVCVYQSAGLEVVKFLQYVCSNDIDKAVGSIVHTGMQNNHGGYENDCSVIRLAHNRCYCHIHLVQGFLTGGISFKGEFWHV